MSLLRLMIGMFMKEQDLFSFHVPGLSSIMARKMTFRQIFSHRGQRESFNIRITVCASCPAEAMHWPDNQSIMVAV
jgi:hypothetical protein